jgi:hypothetical protein
MCGAVVKIIVKTSRHDKGSSTVQKMNTITIMRTGMYLKNNGENADLDRGTTESQINFQLTQRKDNPGTDNSCPTLDRSFSRKPCIYTWHIPARMIDHQHIVPFADTARNSHR